MDKPLTVIVPHFNDPAGLDACLDALAAQTLGRDRFDIIVADNNSPQGLDAIAGVVADRATLVSEIRPGAAHARNAALPRVATPYIAFTDSDCVPDPDWLATGLAALRSGSADFFGGEMRVSRPQGRALTGAEVFETVFAFKNEAYVRMGFSVTANLFTPWALFDTVGPFRDGVSEDKDWCLRAVAAGFRIGYAAGAIVSHPPRPDWPALKKKWRRLQSEMAALEMQRPGGRLTWLARSLAMPLSVPAHAPRVLRAQGLAAGEKWRGLGTLARLRLWRFVEGTRQVLRGGS